MPHSASADMADIERLQFCAVLRSARQVGAPEHSQGTQYLAEYQTSVRQRKALPHTLLHVHAVSSIMPFQSHSLLFLHVMA